RSAPVLWVANREVTRSPCLILSPPSSSIRQDISTTPSYHFGFARPGVLPDRSLMACRTARPTRCGTLGQGCPAPIISEDRLFAVLAASQFPIECGIDLPEKGWQECRETR